MTIAIISESSIKPLEGSDSSSLANKYCDSFLQKSSHSMKISINLVCLGQQS